MVTSVHSCPGQASLVSQRLAVTLDGRCTCREYVRKRGTVRTRSSANRMQELRRRSTRMALKARITLSGHDHAKCGFTMPAGATSLNKHGAAIQVNRELLVGSIIVLQNRQTQASARVVKQVSAHRQGVYIYGVEFLEADVVGKNFWGINFPLPAVPK
jgi:hypothetical protein